MSKERIASGSSSRLLQAIIKDLDITITGEKFLHLIENIIEPRLQGQFNQGIKHVIYETQKTLIRLELDQTEIKIK